jgi:hypothetical protein
MVPACVLFGACSDDEDHCDEVSGTACVFAGRTGELGFNGDGLALRDSRLYWPVDMEFAPDGTAWVLDWNNHRVRRVVDGTFETVIGDFVGDGPADQSDLTVAGERSQYCIY